MSSKKSKIVYIVPKDWLDEKLRQVGLWTIRGIGTLLFYALIKALLFLHIIDLREVFNVSEQAKQLAR